jgi:nitroreductase / dihydropteridine reductase
MKPGLFYRGNRKSRSRKEMSMEFKDVVMQRYATKAFTDQKVPEEKIDELLDLIRFAPSALNLQPWKVKVVSDQATRDQLAPAMFGQPQAVRCSHLLILCANTDIDDVIATADRVMKDAGFPDDRRAQMIGMANTVKANFTPAWAQQQVYLAFANAVNGAKSLGLDSCPMTGFDPAQVSKILGLPANLVPTAVVPVGYGADAPVAKARLSRENLLI